MGDNIKGGRLESIQSMKQSLLVVNIILQIYYYSFKISQYKYLPYLLIVSENTFQDLDNGQCICMTKWFSIIIKYNSVGYFFLIISQGRLSSQVRKPIRLNSHQLEVINKMAI